VTRDHVTYWLGNGLSTSSKQLDGWIAELGDRIVRVSVDGTEAFVLREHVDDLGRAEPTRAVRFLPGHDQWVMGTSTKDTHVVPPALRQLMTRKANPVTYGGVVCGTWARAGDVITVTWLDERRRPRQALEQETARLAAIAGRDLTLQLGE
jgi:hypothetical protein